MSRGPRLGRFGFQLRLVLVLLVLVLITLDLLNLFLLDRSRDDLERAERRTAATRLEALVQRLGPDVLSFAVEGGRPHALTSSTLRRFAARYGFDHLALLDRAGREVLASGPSNGLNIAAYAELPLATQSAIAAGRIEVGPLRPADGGGESRLTAFHPLIGSDGRHLGSAAGAYPAPALGRLHRTFRRIVAIQIGALVVLGLAAAVFARWVSRPYRRLALVAGEAGLTAGDAPGPTEPDDLAGAFRAVVDKLHRQDDALSRLGPEGGGLGDLVRFAGKGAREMSTGVLVIDRNLEIAALNPAAVHLLGPAADRAVGLPLAQAGRAVEGLAGRAQECLSRGVSLSREVLARHDAAGRPGHLGVSVSPATGRDDRVAGALILMTDLTEIRELQDQARLRDSLAQVGQLSAGIAHEVRNALGTILGYARMVEKRRDPETLEPAREILREVDQVRSVVDEFLLYARPPQPERVSVSLERLLSGSAATAPDVLEIELKGEFGDVQADEGLLRRAFDNLLRNAADAAEAGPTKVTITGRRAGSGRMLQIDVEDDGPGIPAGLQDQIFVPFYTTKTRGTGLGLALVQRTIVDLGGSIELAPPGERGALFRIRLPLDPGTTEM